MSLRLGSLTISSPAFKALDRIPSRYAGDGKNISPPLEWSGAPAETREFALVCHDPDAPLRHGFTHWVVYGIPRATTSMPEGAEASAFAAGLNDSGASGYVGPYPPKGHGVHHYYFWLYALDVRLESKPGMNRSQLLEAVQGHLLEQARLVGTYER